MAYIIRGIDIENLLNARKKFEKFRQNLRSEQEKAGAIQAYEYTYELAWKTMKRLLNEQGVEVASPRSCIREAAINNMISDPLIWFACLDLRNLAAHTYNQQNSDEVLAIFDAFSRALSEFITNIEQLT